MNLICTLYDISEVIKFKQLGIKELIISDKRFATVSNSVIADEQLMELISLVHDNDMHLSIRCDAFFYEEDIADLSDYLDKLLKFKVDGIYFTDMAVYQIAKEKNMEKLLVFDGNTTLTNNRDLKVFLKLGLKRCVIAKELTYEKVLGILDGEKKKSEMIGFGHLRMSQSRRLMLTGYQEVFLNSSIHGNPNIKAQEESRNERFPIFEDEMGTYTYSSYIFWCLNELKVLNDHVDHLRLDRFFISDQLYFEVIKAYQDVLKGDDPNAIIDRLKKDYPHESFGTGFLYEQTTL
ncbi:MAG: U32 family peptidase [Erysipelotrichaceae bacterium]|nr:U32 family peptidase [Erysipelotrichaceae bacterium]MDD3923954.1 U32 family peptidase [Erysipelotrichaceae bacterium]MDD4642226.1 U32 family peptidase [Erysipelotrichaceae bacterium]